MKQGRAWLAGAAGVGALLGVGGLTVATGHATERATACSVGTLHGRYLFAFQGVQVKGKAQLPFAVAGYETYQGNGTVNLVATASQNGKISRNVRLSGRYSVRPDCTGGGSYPSGERWDLYAAPDGSMFTFIGTNAGSVGSGFELRGTARRVGG